MSNKELISVENEFPISQTGLSMHPGVEIIIENNSNPWDWLPDDNRESLMNYLNQVHNLRRNSLPILE